MPYAPNKLMELVSLQKFIELDAFINIMESMYETDLNHDSMRRQSQLRITQLYKQVPVVAPNLRFPDKYHVNLSVGAIADSLRKLIRTMALLKKDDNDDNSDKDNDDDDNSDDDDSIDYDEDQIYFYMHALDQQQLAEAGIYNRASFEEKYGWVWYDN